MFVLAAGLMTMIGIGWEYSTVLYLISKRFLGRGDSLHEFT
jgi:hypothetical protein